MRRFIPALVAACLMLTVQAADLDIEVRGIKSLTGRVHAALFANADDLKLDLTMRATVSKEGEIRTGIFTAEGLFPKPPTDSASAPANAKTISLRMTDLEPGSYALAVYQDVNDDGKLDTSIAGVPLEPWGMSNNPPHGDRPPTWADGQFTLPPEGARLVIYLK
jgi:uncharacterized protein (DUF2141 family)